MGNPISKFAFVPPDPEYARHVLRKCQHHRFVFTAKGNPVSMVHIPGPKGGFFARTKRKTLIFSHGNAEDLGNLEYYVALAAEVGADVVAYDYSGYGMSTSRREYEVEHNGAPEMAEAGCGISSGPKKERMEPSEADCFACADAVYDYVRHMANVPDADIVVVGRSLGSGCATHLATQHPAVHALILLSPLKSCANVVGPVAGFLLTPIDMMRNSAKLHKLISTPVLIVHGTEDRVIPFAHAEALEMLLRKDAGNLTAYLVPVPGADHNDVEAIFGRSRFSTLLNGFITDPSTRPAEARVS
jgi:pimeloyl-ACP methyl ester carboxylesterase